MSTSSVAADQWRSIRLGPLAVAVKPGGAEGGDVSATTGRVTLVLFLSPLESVAVRITSYENVPIGPWFSATKLPELPLPPTNVWTCVLWCNSTVHCSAGPLRLPSSGSVADPW